MTPNSIGFGALIFNFSISVTFYIAISFSKESKEESLNKYSLPFIS